MTRNVPVWVVGATGLAIAVGIVLRLMIPAGMDPTIFLALGEDAPIQTDYARAAVGDVATRKDYGHDGKFFFIQANDPWLTDPEANAAFLDRPVYRAQRMLFPLIAGGLGLFPPGVIVWAMLITNILCIGLGTLLAGQIAKHWGASPWLGLSVPLNIGLLFELWIDGSGILAYVLCLGALYALAVGKGWAAAVLLAAAALSREVMVVFAIGLVVLGWVEEHKIRWRLLLVPSVAIGLWNAYLRFRLMGVSGVGSPWPFFGPPLFGMFEAFESWTEDRTYLVLNLAILLLAIAFVVLGLRTRSTIAWGALPFVALSTVLSVYVWREAFDISRILAPVFTAAPFLLFLPRSAMSVGLTGSRR